MRKMNSLLSTPKSTPRSLFQLTWPLLCWNAVVAFFISCEFINMLVISDLIWPDEEFRALEISILLGARLWADGICAVFWGILVDKPRLSRKSLFMISALFTGLLIISNALIPNGQGTTSYIWWISIRIFIGLFMSCGGPMFNSISSDLLTQEERSQFFGLAGLCWTIFQTLGMLISAYMFQIGLWNVFIGSSGLMFLIWLVAFWLLFQEPKRASQDSSVKNLIQTTKIKYEYEMNSTTLRKTMLSKTNILILFEGFFLSTVFNLVYFLVFPYILSPPHNISTVSMTLVSIFFGIPGGIIGMIFLAKLSDKFGGKNLHRRIKLIVGSVIIGISCYFVIFLIPIPHLTPEEGNNIGYVMGIPEFYYIGIFMLLSNAFLSMYGINQAPIVQEINLPEGRGKIASWNQFIEVVSSGTGPVIAGVVLSWLGNNYQLTFQILLLLIIPGILIWLCALRFIDKDLEQIQDILKKRAEEMQMQLKK